MEFPDKLLEEVSEKKLKKFSVEFLKEFGGTFQVPPERITVGFPGGILA